MKKFKVMLSVLMVLIIIFVSAIPSLAVVAPEDAVASGVLWSDKIDQMVWEKINLASENEKIPVWIWFTDVDKSKVESMVTKETGLTKNDLAVNTSASAKNLVLALEEASNKNSVSVMDEANYQMELYLDATEEERKLARQRTVTYLRAKRSIISKLYTENNKNIIDQLNINSNDIVFQSRLTNSVIMNLLPEDIFNIANSNCVVSVDYYDSSDCVQPLQENEQNTMQVDAVKLNNSLTGSNVNVLMNEAGYVRSDVDGYNNLTNPSNIEVIINKTLYSTTQTSVMPTGQTNHATHVASVLQSYAKDAHIYSTSSLGYSDIEWALENCDIDLINASVNYSISTCNTYNSQAKWFDAIVSTYDVALIASAGNSYNWSNINWPYVISPASSYNSIAVGAYSTNGVSKFDEMKDFRYAPVTGSTVPCYKPDVVIAAPDTSTAAPALSGIVSMMIQLEPSLSSQPETIKAILMASCHRKVSSIATDTQELMIDGLTQKQGAGAVDAYRVIKIILESTYGVKTITNTSSASVASFLLPEIEDVNVSIAWSRENKKGTNLGSTILGTIQELELEVYKGTELLKSSTKTNTGKQLVYLKDLYPNTTYNIKVKKTTNNNEAVVYGYAWSGKNYTQAEMELQGKNAVGQTLTANMTYIDGKTVADDDVTYQWQSSSDNVVWQNISGATSKTYMLTSEERTKYIKCEGTLLDDTLSGATKVSDTTDTRIILYGDVDLSGSVGANDATIIQFYVAEMTDLTDEQKIAADVTGEGIVNGADAVYIQRYLAEMIFIFPVEE